MRSPCRATGLPVIPKSLYFTIWLAVAAEPLSSLELTRCRLSDTSQRDSKPVETLVTPAGSESGESKIYSRNWHWSCGASPEAVVDDSGTFSHSSRYITPVSVAVCAALRHAAMNSFR